jgi:excinuclease UvrABC nuclease subunit
METVSQQLVYDVVGPRSQYPALPGVYTIWCNYGNGDPVHWDRPAYIGQTKNFRERMMQHRNGRSRLFTDAAMVTFIHVPQQDIRRVMEVWLIRRHHPSYNQTHRIHIMGAA